jgi:hypothetical protein
MVATRHEARLTIKPNDETLPPEVARAQQLEAEVAELRQRVRSLQSAVRSAALVLRPYTSNDRKR